METVKRLVAATGENGRKDKWNTENFSEVKILHMMLYNRNKSLCFCSNPWNVNTKSET